MPMYDITAEVHHLGELEKKGEKQFPLQTLVLLDRGKYDNYYPIIFKGDKTLLLEGIRQGQRVKITFAVKGREWNGKWFADISGIKLQVMDQSQPSQQPAPPPPFPSPPPQPGQQAHGQPIPIGQTAPIKDYADEHNYDEEEIAF